MRSLIIALSLRLVLASSQIGKRDCNHDNCLRAVIRASTEAASFCSTYAQSAPSGTGPAWIAPCSGSPARISSACSCINTAVISTSISSVTISDTITISTSSSTSNASPTSPSSAAGSTTNVSSFTSSSSTASSTTSASSFTSSSSTTSDTTSETSSISPSSSASGTISVTSAISSTSSSPTTSNIPCQRTVPPPDAIVVDNSANPFPNSYPSMQQGVNALSLTIQAPQSIFVYPGSYYEQVYIPPLQSNLTVQGWTTDCSSYQGNMATITYNLALLNTTSDDLTATIRSWNPNTKFYNLNIANTFGHVSKNGQNLAVSAHTGNQGFYGVQLLGYQDTLLANTGNQLYAKSLITGAVDFIFGQTATAWFENVDIRTIATGCITASGRASASNPSWYVINNSNVAGINDSIPAGTNYLGRPWYSFARVVFQNTYLSDVIKPAGWSVWSTSVNGSTNIQNVTFAEFGNYGPGSVFDEGPRANFSEQLSEPVAIESILGANYQDEWWVDMSYM